MVKTNNDTKNRTQNYKTNYQQNYEKFTKQNYGTNRVRNERKK